LNQDESLSFWQPKMSSSSQQYKEGDLITYKTVDMEYYSRGYGLSYETKTSKIVEICYRMENGDTITVRNIQTVEDSKKEPKKDSTS
jgi:hypothetical protein